MNGNRKTYHEVLDSVLDKMTDEELSQGIVDVIVQRGMVNADCTVYNKVMVHALCCPVDDGIVIDDLYKTEITEPA